MLAVIGYWSFSENSRSSYTLDLPFPHLTTYSLLVLLHFSIIITTSVQYNFILCLRRGLELTNHMGHTKNYNHLCLSARGTLTEVTSSESILQFVLTLCRIIYSSRVMKGNLLE